MVQRFNNMTATVPARQWTVRNYGSGKVTLISVNANKAVIPWRQRHAADQTADVLA